MPGVSKNLAWKLSFHILTLEKSKVLDMAGALTDARESARRCSVCQNYTDSKICSICSSSMRSSDKRNNKILCVVESPREVLTLEKSGCFFGKYHVLHGLLSPTEGVGPA